MHKLLYLYIILLVSLIGCEAADKYKRDYLRSDEWREGQMREAALTIKNDYLGAEQPVMDATRTTIVTAIARDSLLQSPYQEDFQPLSPVIDQDPAMPETLPYIFIHFLPYEGRVDLDGLTYLVVIERLSNTVMFADIYERPKGDPFYRYNAVIKDIRK